METVSELCVGCDGGRFQGGMWYGENMRVIGSWDKGWDLLGAAPVAASRPGGGLGVSPH